MPEKEVTQEVLPSHFVGYELLTGIQLKNREMVQRAARELVERGTPFAEYAVCEGPPVDFTEDHLRWGMRAVASMPDFDDSGYLLSTARQCGYDAQWFSFLADTSSDECFNYTVSNVAAWRLKRRLHRVYKEVQQEYRRECGAELREIGRQAITGTITRVFSRKIKRD